MPSNHAPLSASRWATPYYQPTSRPYHIYPQVAYPLNQEGRAGGSYPSRFDPAASDFQPSGTEIQPYQTGIDSMVQPGTTPDPCSSSAQMTQIQKFVMDNHFDQTKHITTLERRTTRADAKIDQMHAMMSNDFQMLQKEIQDLKQGMRDHIEERDMLARGNRTGAVDMPQTGPLGDFSRSKIAETYLDEADDFDEAASKLRSQAKEMCPDAAEERMVKLKLVDGPTGQDEDQVEFACCREVFTSVEDLLIHVNEGHGPPPDDLEKTPTLAKVNARAVAGTTTPTHMPKRRDLGVEAVNLSTTPEPIEPTSKTTSSDTTSKDNEAVDVETKLSIVHKHDNGSQTAPEAPWRPLAVRQMPTSKLVDTSCNLETFTWEFLTANLGGKQWSPGFYYVPQSLQSDLPSRSYWILEAEYEPFLPSTPGDHGAKITGFFNLTPIVEGQDPEAENFLNVPVFIRAEGKDEYVYFGDYSQLRFSDKLDYDRVMDAVPEKVRKYWADQLSDRGRPEWVTKALMDHFWPKPTYNGPVLTESTVSSVVSAHADKKAKSLDRQIQRAFDAYLVELDGWKKEAEMKVSHLSSDALMKAFETPDAVEEPGLRLWWEYLQCVEYSQGFHDYLVKIKQSPGLQRKPVAISGSGSGRKGSKKIESRAKMTETKTAVNGDLELAKKMHENFTKAKPGRGSYLPPHLRGRAAKDGE